MITFITHFPFSETAKRLDYRRLGKQRLEAKQIINLLWEVKYTQKNYHDLARIKSLHYLNHPSVKMWYHYELALIEYYNCIVKEWIARGYKNTMPIYDLTGYEIEYPKWLFETQLQISHRQMLLYKELTRAEKPWYSYQIDFIAYYTPNPSYIWPVKF